jgi:FKBP-type peptidyl-prolyl cis-trans isomerase FkpA
MIRVPLIFVAIGSVLAASGCQRLGSGRIGDGDKAGEVQERAASEALLEAAAAEPGAVRTASGIVFRDTRVGGGPTLKAHDTVTIRNEARLRDGTLLSNPNGETAELTVPLERLLPCLREALVRMRTGGAAHVVCPAREAYGEAGSPPVVPAGSAVVAEIELVDVGRPLPHGGH